MSKKVLDNILKLVKFTFIYILTLFYPYLLGQIRGEIFLPPCCWVKEEVSVFSPHVIGPLIYPSLLGQIRGKRILTPFYWVTFYP